MNYGVLTIGGKEYTTIDTELCPADLKFYEENPRVYSVLNMLTNEKPEQQQIEDLLTKMEHVKQLRLSIESNGGLIDPLIVRDGDLVVLEGNSRLAAYRILTAINPIKWGKVKCKLLPADIEESAIFALLGQYHIVGRKDWSPFEQAGYLYRRQKNTKFPVEHMAKELGITKSQAQRFVDIYTFMVEHEDLTPNRWSYYEEYLKSAVLKKLRQKNEDLDSIVVTKIKSGEVSEAIDIRKISDIAKVNDKQTKKVLKQVLDGDLTIKEGYKIVEEDGKFDDVLKILKKFRSQINTDDFYKKIKENELSPEVLFEVKKIINRLSKILGDEK